MGEGYGNGPGLRLGGGWPGLACGGHAALPWVVSGALLARQAVLPAMTRKGGPKKLEHGGEDMCPGQCHVPLVA